MSFSSSQEPTWRSKTRGQPAYDVQDDHPRAGCQRGYNSCQREGCIAVRSSRENDSDTPEANNRKCWPTVQSTKTAGPMKLGGLEYSFSAGVIDIRLELVQWHFPHLGFTEQPDGCDGLGDWLDIAMLH